MANTMERERELIFSVTRKDFDVQYTRGTGKGGQKRNKTSSACRITHRESGAVGYAEDTRSQAQNRAKAFMRMYQSPKFQSWWKIKVGRMALTDAEIRSEVERQMRPENLLIELGADIT